MKTILTSFVLFTASYAFAQKSLLISASAGNAGQAEKIMESYFEFYWQYPPFAVPYPVIFFYPDGINSDTKSIEVIPQLQVEYGSDSSGYWRLKFGYMRKKNQVTTDVNNIEGDAQEYEINQDYGFASFGFAWNLPVKKFLFSFGMELPVIWIGKSESDFRYSYSDFSQESKIKKDGGFATGINSFTSVRFLISKKYFFRTDFSVGIQYAYFGNNVSFEQTTRWSQAQQEFYNSSVWKEKHQLLSVTHPEVSLGIGIRF